MVSLNTQLRRVNPSPGFLKWVHAAVHSLRLLDPALLALRSVDRRISSDPDAMKKRASTSGGCWKLQAPVSTSSEGPYERRVRRAVSVAMKKSPLVARSRSPFLAS
jgi:hypothetical protein